MRPTRNLWGIPNMQIPPRDRELYCRSCLFVAEGEVNASHVLEVVLAGRVTDSVIRTKVGVRIVHFDRPDLNRLVDGPIQAAAELHGEPVVTAVTVHRLALVLQNGAVSVGVRTAEQGFPKGLQVA